ncbi:MAG: hypothetical protein WBZ20_13130 [Nitrososphaeraceae archaeon]
MSSIFFRVCKLYGQYGDFEKMNIFVEGFVDLYLRYPTEKMRDMLFKSLVNARGYCANLGQIETIDSYLKLIRELPETYEDEGGRKWLAMALYNAVYGCRVFHKQNQLYDFLNQLNALYQQFPESGIKEYVVKAYQKIPDDPNLVWENSRIIDPTDSDPLMRDLCEKSINHDLAIDDDRHILIAVDRVNLPYRDIKHGKYKLDLLTIKQYEGKIYRMFVEWLIEAHYHILQPNRKCLGADSFNRFLSVAPDNKIIAWN